MPKQEHIDEVAGYLKSFEDGSRPHAQSDHFTPHQDGVAFSLGGAKAFDDATQSGLVDIEWNQRSQQGHVWLYSDQLRLWLSSKYPNGPYPDNYARCEWNLLWSEMYSIDDSDLTLDQMKEGLRAIAASHGLTCPAFEG